MTHTIGVIDQTTREFARSELVRVERKPSETDAYFIVEGEYEVITSNGKSYCEAPVWILWDTSGFPYPITPEEFEMLYDRVEES